MAWKEINKILCTTDFSDLSFEAIHYAVGLAQECNAKIDLIHVLPSFPFSQMPFQYQDDALNIEELAEKKAIEELNNIAEKYIPKEYRANVQIKKDDSAYLGIINYSNELDIDIIIVTTHGFGGFKHAVFGSTTERVVRLASCPVLSIKIKGK